MRLRLRFALLASAPLFLGCLSSTQPGSAPDCTTFATSYAIATDLTTTASGLQYRDVVVGPGAGVTAGSTVVTYYSACLTTGELFSQVAAPSRFVFPVGAGTVPAGLDEGVQGMRLGGRRQLVIPAALGYGTGGSPGGFAVPNATFVMTVDAVGLR
jgi:FKBP-type peptidyl-prolyl cis-trans isomerase